MKSVRLEEIVDICSSKRIKMSEYVTSGIPFYRSKEIINLHKNQNIQTELFIPEERFDEINLKSGSPIEGDILLTSVGTLGVPYQVKKDDKFYFKDGNLTWFRNFSNDVNQRYFYFWLTSPIAKRKFDEITIGSTQKALTIVSLKGIEIDIPSISEQNKIAEVIGEIQEKIELNQRMNETLEEITKTLFKSWFIDFDPVRAKAEGRPTGLSKEISDLFPDSFEDSELGEIPKGWEINKLGHHINLTKGKSYKSAELQESDTALVTLKSFQRNGGYREDGLKEYIGSYKDEQIVSDGDLIVAFTDVTQAADVIGKPAIVIGNPNYSRLVISLDVGVIRVVPESILTNAFIYFLMLSNRYASNSLGYTNGTNVLHLKKEAITEYDFCLPNNNSLLKIYNDISKNMLEKVSKNSLENITLEKLRDTLLPKLISGELKIPDAENLVEKAGI